MTNASTILLLLLAFAAGLAGALLVLRAQGRAIAAEVAAAGASSRDAELRGAIDHVITLANERLGAHTAQATGALDASQERIGSQLGALNAELQRVTTVMSSLEQGRERQHGALHEQLATASRSTAELAETTRQLREVLASSRARGQWGERMAEDVLRMAGFIEGVNYRKQRGIAGGGIPDFTFLLPEDREVRMDVKFPFDNYLRALDAGSETEQVAFTKAFLADVRARVKELRTRNYMDPEVTVDCVLLFIPNESLYGWIHEHDPELLDVALGQRVVLCSPMTLFAVLAVIRQAMDAFTLARASDEILTLLAGFTKEWERFCTQLDTLGTHVDRTANAYEALRTTRRRQLERQLDRIEDLRVQRGLTAREDDGQPADAEHPVDQAVEEPRRLRPASSA
jgi:DNA recombination protein RmuC